MSSPDNFLMAEISSIWENISLYLYPACPSNQTTLCLDRHHRSSDIIEPYAPEVTREDPQNIRVTASAWGVVPFQNFKIRKCITDEAENIRTNQPAVARTRTREARTVKTIETVGAPTQKISSPPFAGTPSWPRLSSCSIKQAEWEEPEP